MDSPLPQLAAHPEVWVAVNDVFESHFPGYRLDSDPTQMETLSLAILLEHIPGAPAGLAAEFEAALQTTPADDSKEPLS